MHGIKTYLSQGSQRFFKCYAIYPLNLQQNFAEAAKDVADPLRAAPSLLEKWCELKWIRNWRTCLTCPSNSRKRKLKKILKNERQILSNFVPRGRIGSIAERDQWGISWFDWFDWFGCLLHCDPLRFAGKVATPSPTSKAFAGARRSPKDEASTWEEK